LSRAEAIAVGELEVFDVAGAQMRGEQQSHPESRKPIAVASASLGIAGRERCRHGLSIPAWTRDIGEEGAKTRLVFQLFAGDEVHRLCLPIEYDQALSEQSCKCRLTPMRDNND
jgi:hypothetical protein